MGAQAPPRHEPSSPARPRVVVIGGGFGGVAVARSLERHLPRNAVELHLISRENFFLFQPMLPEVAGASIEPHHILAPLRQLCPRTTVTVGMASAIDLDRRSVTVRHGRHEAETVIPYDLLILAVGSVTNFSELTGMAQHALGLKTVGDALYLRNHLIAMLEEADVETDPVRRRELLTFVVVGGGFSGVETVAQVNDFVREAARHYRRIDHGAIRVILLHAQDRILPELNEELARVAHRHLERLGVEVWVRRTLEAVTEREAILDGGEEVPTCTLVATIGAATNPLIASLDCEKDARGRAVVTPELQLVGREDVWALGDCAAVPNAATGSLAPPTAQFAVREAEVVAQNVAAAIRGGARRRFSYPGLGQFVSLGRRSAVAEVLRFKVTGFPAWFLWRTVYLAKLPTAPRKTRVALDWTLDLLFGRDITQLPLARGERLGRAHFEPGDTIVRQGEVGDLFYVITEGEVEVVREGADGEEVVVNRLGAGDYFGEVALLRSARRNATVRARTDVNVITLGRDDFSLLARSWASLREALRATAATRGG